VRRRYSFPKRYADVAARLRVPAGFLLAALFVWFSDPTPASLAWGTPISICGLLLRAWAAGHLAKNERLATTGPYAHLRNPLYAGTVLTAAGLAVAAREAWLAAAFALFFVFFYLPVIQEEEKHLRDLFPEYERYAAEVPLLVPRLKPAARGRFRWSLYRRNEEYNAAFGYLAGLAVLAWKAWHAAPRG